VNTVVGQAGEYLTAGILIDMGLQVMVSPTDGCDLLAFDADRYWRVEVKTSSHPEKDKLFARFRCDAQFSDMSTKSRR